MEKPKAIRSDPEARRAYGRWHYQQNRAKYIRRAAEFNKVARAKARQFIGDYLASHPCVDCGEDDPIVLEFDHRPGTKKRFEIGDIRRKGYSIETIAAEIEKCDVRCANCHRRIAHARGQYHSRK